MPRVVPDQKSKFENEEFFRKLSRECEAFVATGTNLSLQFFPASWQGEPRQTPSREYVDLEREAGKVYLKAPMILNGVCVIWKGWIDLQRLDGMGCLEFDEERAQQEDALAQQAFEEARRRTREFEDRDRSHREEMESHQSPVARQKSRRLEMAQDAVDDLGVFNVWLSSKHSTAPASAAFMAVGTDCSPPPTH
ncbi:core-binding factor subunit beta isoform X4 [Macrotis lagotis]|uniref:core-binding factor subunit beta isoform X4 n=1 Tax=Macrotis lagotis TaxID=92651 RepID=UPI003D688A85